MKQFKFFAVIIVFAVFGMVAATGVAKSGSGAIPYIGYYKASPVQYWCDWGYYDWGYDCDHWAFGETCTISGYAAFDVYEYCTFDYGSAYYAKRIY
ncbi:hypothetical protein [Chitinophaga sp. CB10]|uniref:hypothetical protein n=1 Tax=Chitinophaga sp. CB10 TaxID=1891659 RepID=UPI0025C46D8E|nr:hypothetical protein [Chitinophaga sp. CB10]